MFLYDSEVPTFNEASSPRSIRRISGDKEFYSICPNGKRYVTFFFFFFIFGLFAIRLPDALRPRPV